MLNIYNPTDSVLEVAIGGLPFSVGPHASVVVPADVALHWKKYVHEFIVVSEVEQKKEVISEPVVAKKEEPVTVARAVKQAVVKKRVQK